MPPDMLKLAVDQWALLERLFGKRAREAAEKMRDLEEKKAAARLDKEGSLGASVEHGR